MKKSMNSRLAFARENNQYAAQALLNNLNITGSTTKATQPKASTPLRSAYKSMAKSGEYDDQELPNYNCVCNRQAQVVECRKCKMLFYGRVSEYCPRHPNVTYLLDFFYCPSCTCSKDYLKVKSAAC